MKPRSWSPGAAKGQVKDVRGGLFRAGLEIPGTGQNPGGPGLHGGGPFLVRADFAALQYRPPVQNWPAAGAHHHGYRGRRPVPPVRPWPGCRRLLPLPAAQREQSEALILPETVLSVFWVFRDGVESDGWPQTGGGGRATIMHHVMFKTFSILTAHVKMKMF